MKYSLHCIALMLTALFFIACAQEAQPVVTNAAYGEAFEKTTSMKVSDAMTKVQHEGEAKAIQVEGIVTSVCQVKGCWMNIKDESTGDEMFVKFKDYGFFMPKDLAGNRVVMRGNAFKEVTSVEDLKHYAEDEGLSQEEIDAITEPEESINFLADGVIVL